MSHPIFHIRLPPRSTIKINSKTRRFSFSSSSTLHSDRPGTDHSMAKDTTVPFSIIGKPRALSCHIDSCQMLTIEDSPSNFGSSGSSGNWSKLFGAFSRLSNSSSEAPENFQGVIQVGLNHPQNQSRTWVTNRLTGLGHSCKIRNPLETMPPAPLTTTPSAPNWTEPPDPSSQDPAPKPLGLIGHNSACW